MCWRFFPTPPPRRTNKCTNQRNIFDLPWIWICILYVPQPTATINTNTDVARPFGEPLMLTRTILKSPEPSHSHSNSNDASHESGTANRRVRLNWENPRTSSNCTQQKQQEQQQQWELDELLSWRRIQLWIHYYYYLVCSLFIVNMFSRNCSFITFILLPCPAKTSRKSLACKRMRMREHAAQ